MNHKTVILRFAHIWSCLSPSHDSPNMADAGHFENMCSVYSSQTRVRKFEKMSLLLLNGAFPPVHCCHQCHVNYTLPKRVCILAEKLQILQCTLMILLHLISMQFNKLMCCFFKYLHHLLQATCSQSFTSLKLFDSQFFAKCNSAVKYYLHST